LARSLSTSDACEVCISENFDVPYEIALVQYIGNLFKGVSQKILVCERSRVCTCEGLDAIPEHGKDNSGHDAEIAEPETERRSVENREGYMKPGTNGSIEDDDESDD